MNKSEIVMFIVIGVIIFILGFGFGTLWSEPMMVLSAWRHAYAEKNLENLKCKDELLNMKTQYYELKTKGETNVK